MGNLKEYFKIALRNLRTRQLRSWLTIIGVVIGVFLIMSLMSLSEGIKTAIMQQLRMMGKDLVMVFPGEITDIMTTFVGGLELSDDDIRAIDRTEGVEVALPMSVKGEVMRYEGSTKTVLIAGVPWEKGMDVLTTDLGWHLSAGRWPSPGKREVLVGSVVPEDIFPTMTIGTEAVMKGKRFEVVGILRSVGNKQDDSMIILDLDIFREVTGARTGAQFVFAKVSAGYDTEVVVENIKEELRETRKRKRGEDLPSFSVLSSEKVTGIVTNVVQMIQLAVFGFASIAIIVGGIGIMNTMYTSVFERIKEIGIMKAVGAKNRTITTIFLIESGIFGLVGGLGGMVLGLGLAKMVELYFQIHPIFYLEASITPGLVFFGLAFSFLVGCLSGFVPSVRASRYNPVDALRYE